MVSVAAGSEAMSAGVEARWRVGEVAGGAVDADGETFAASLQAAAQASETFVVKFVCERMPGSKW